MALRVKFDPVEDPTAKAILVESGRVSFAQFGDGNGFASLAPLPAELSFSCRLFTSGRAGSESTQVDLNVLKGRLRLEPSPSPDVFEVSFESDAESLDAWQERYAQSLDEREAPFLVSPAEIVLDLPPEQFTGLESLLGAQLRLALPKVAEGKRYAEILVELSVDGQVEASAHVNDVLDVPLHRVALVDVRIFLFDLLGARLPNAPYRLTLDDAIRTGEADADGLVEQSELPDSSAFLLEWGRPADGAEEGSFAFCRYVHLIDAPSDEQGRVLRLDNLGYLSGSQAERLAQFADDFRQDVAELGGKEPALFAVHDEGRPFRA